jgi:hypothetical protein
MPKRERADALDSQERHLLAITCAARTERAASLAAEVRVRLQPKSDACAVHAQM